MEEVKPNDNSSETSDNIDISDISHTSHDEDENPIESSQQPDLVLARTENRWVWRLRLLVALVLLSATLAVCLAVYFRARNKEQTDFEEDFTGLADKLVVSFENVVKQRFGAIDLFFADVTSYANNSWPFVTPPDYTRKMAEVHKLANLFVSTMLVKVEDDQRLQWEEYAVAHQDWKREGLAFLMGKDPKDVVAAPMFTQIIDKDTNPDEPFPDAGPGPYFPTWMQHPIQNRTQSNQNMYRDPEHKGNMDYVIANKRPAFGQSFDYIDKPKDGRFHMLQQMTHGDYQGDAFSVGLFPIFNRLGENATVAGLFFTVVQWRTYFNGLLPKGADGIYIILENTCGQQYTYQVDGLEARAIGLGDLHSPKYDYLGQETSIDIILDGDESMTSSEGPSCHYSIRVYPSEEFRKSFESNEPLVFAITLGSVFVFTAAVFILYDCMVERRQKAIMKSAQQSGKIVHSLFPEAVRDQLYQEQEAANKAATWQAAEHRASKVAQAIAKEYPETTVFFADLVGFTKWSSTRTPVEVFQLLEALYGEFDKVALKKGVFKVETIGDCYVAVAGLPDPQEKHAEIMVKFSFECITRMRNVVSTLVDILGEDTANLAMRVGLHSGPVTGGVLRGQKSRFQLFGDTVNTASRMESNGMSGMIHVSESTADELKKLGRSSWLVARDRKLPIKGKGDMQTYFVQSSSLTASVSHLSSTFG